jgi:predicted permease
VGPHFGDLLSRVRQLPGVESTAISVPSVMSSGHVSGEVRGKDIRPGRADGMYVSPAYFATMRIPLMLGRDFTIADRKGTQQVAIVDQRFASRFWPGQNPIGKHFGVGAPGGRDTIDSEVVGVVGDSVYHNLRDKRSPTSYWAYDQILPVAGWVEVRFHGSAVRLERDLRQIVEATLPGFEISNASSLEMMRDGLIAQDRLLAFLSSMFGVLGTALALVGIYGLISYSVTRRTREIGIRMSVGAQRGDVLWLFVREGVLLVFGGTLIGLPIALDLARLLQKMLYEVSTYDASAIAATVVLMAIGGLIASLLPAGRATRVNPVEALRYD